MTERRDPSGEVTARVPLTEAERRQLELDQAETPEEKKLDTRVEVMA